MTMSPLTWLLAVGLLASAYAQSCPPGWTRFNKGPASSASYCYRFYNQQKNWQAAEEVCKREGGHLAGCRNDYHNNFVAQFIIQQGHGLSTAGKL